MPINNADLKNMVQHAWVWEQKKRFFVKKIIRYFSGIDDVRPLAVLISIIISFIVLFNFQPINSDAIYQYFPAVSEFLSHGIRGAMHSYHWPVYPVLIGLCVKWFHLSFVNAAFCVSTFFAVLIVIGFITLVSEVSSDRKVLIAATVTILLFHSFNAFRADVIRGFGYWAFLIFSVIALIRFAKTEKWCHAISWSILMLCAMAFRLEGAFLVCVAPLSLLLLSKYSFWKRVWLVIKSQIVTIILGLCFLIWLLVSGYGAQHLGRFSQVIAQAQHALHDIHQSIVEQATAMSLVYHNYPVERGRVVLIIGFIGYFIWNIIDVLGWVYFFFAVHGLSIERKEIDPDIKKMLLGIMVLSGIAPFLFYMQGYTMSGRYLMPVCFLASVWIPFSFVKIYDDYIKKRPTIFAKKWLFYMLVLILAVEGVSGIIHVFGPSNAYITKAGLWAKEHTSKDAKLYTNHRMILFYANRETWNPKIRHRTELKPWQFADSWKGYDYYLIRVFKNEKCSEDVLLRTQGLKPVKVFYNRSKDKVVVYKASS